MLTKHQKKGRLHISKYLLSLFVDGLEEYMRRVVILDESWVRHFDSEAKKQSMQWKHPGSTPPKKFKSVYLSGKVMASIFWDSKGVIKLDYLVEGLMITVAYHAEELRRLSQEIFIVKKRRNLTRGFLLLQDNLKPTPLKLLWLM